MKNKIIVICGFSASGKDRIAKYLSNNPNYEIITSTTSRPIRPKETDGIEYNFVTKKQFEDMINNNEFIEYRKYNTLVNNMPDIWYYGTNKNSVNLSNKSYVIVLDILGLKELKKHFHNNIISFFIDVDEATRRKRCIGRKDFDITEWNRRYEDDIKRFPLEMVKKEVDYIVENYDFDKCVESIMWEVLLRN